MPRSQTLPQTVVTAMRWPLGVPLALLRYFLRTTPLYRTEEEGSWPADGPPPLPDGVDHAEIQRVDDGSGPLYRRSYEISVRDHRLDAEQLIALIREDPDNASPTEFATFKKMLGKSGQMRVGDEYVVRMPGPWDGPVRVIDTSPTSFRLATLDSHLEAGQIEFRAVDGDDALDFTIESWARSGDSAANVMYHHLKISKEVQLMMWTSFLENLVGLSEGRRSGGLRVRTRCVGAAVFDG